MTQGRSVDVPEVLPRIETDEGFRTNLIAAVYGHPAVCAARERAQAEEKVQWAVEREFYAPAFSASAGYATGAGDVPGVSLSRVAPSDAVSFETGVEAPIGGGIYAGGGIAERVLTESEYGDDLRQTALGARVRVPLLQDRGYGLYRHEEWRMMCEAGRLHWEFRATESDVARTAVLAWFDWLESIADAREIARAVERAEKLYEQTEGRFKLQDVAGYQIFPAKYEVALRKEELEDVRHRTNNRLTSLHEHLAQPLQAGKSEFANGNRADELVAMATNIAQFAAFEFDEFSILQKHGRYQVAQFAVDVAKAEVRLAREKMKDSLDISAGLGWRGESDSGFFGNDELETARNDMYEIGIVWKRPLDKRGARARVDAAEARVREAEANRQLAYNEIMSEFYRAETTFAGARGRLELAQQAVEEARKALEAEEKRFGLGEGTSRNVLDAQKDLTSATRRSVSVAGETARALVNLVHAAGRNPVQLFAEERSTEHVTRKEGDAQDGVN